MVPRSVLLALVGVLAVAALTALWPPARPADAQAQVSGLTFSSEITTNAEPAGQIGIEFPGDNNGVWVSFTFQNLSAGTTGARIVRFNESDFNYDSDFYGNLNCCASTSGRHAFRVLRLNGAEGELPGGRYQVIVLLNTGGPTPLTLQGGFGIRGEGGNDRGQTRDIPGGDEDNSDDGDEDDGGDEDDE